MSNQATAARQPEAAAAGRRAEAAGQPVIYIHGKPCADPSSAKTPHDEPTESPSPWWI